MSRDYQISLISCQSISSVVTQIQFGVPMKQLSYVITELTSGAIQYALPLQDFSSSNFDICTQQLTSLQLECFT